MKNSTATANIFHHITENNHQFSPQGSQKSNIYAAQPSMTSRAFYYISHIPKHPFLVGIAATI